MNRKDLDLISRAFAEGRKFAPVGYDYAVKTVANALAGAENCAGFDRQKFLQRCGVKDGT